MKESFVSQRSEGSLSRPVLDDTDTWLLESRVLTGKKAKIGGKKPSGSKLPKTNIDMPGPNSILSGCGKTKSQPIDCARSISFPAGGLLGKKTLLKMSKISSIYSIIGLYLKAKMMTIVTMFRFQNRNALLIQAHKLVIVVSSKKVLLRCRHQT